VTLFLLFHYSIFYLFFFVKKRIYLFQINYYQFHSNKQTKQTNKQTNKKKNKSLNVVVLQNQNDLLFYYYSLPISMSFFNEEYYEQCKYEK
jgi:hypothetical protein